MSEKKNRQAVNLTEATVLENNWFFREQTVSDQGIDAHVEKYDLVPGKQGMDEVGTGRLLALQIKGGPHYFREPSPNGWWFRFKERKRNPPYQQSSRVAVADSLPDTVASASSRTPRAN